MPAAINDWIQLHRDRIVCDPSLVLTTKKRTGNAQNSSEIQSGTFSAAISTKQDTSARQQPRIVSWRNCEDIETNTDPLTGSNTARTDYWDTVESMSGGRTINLTVHGGTGGSGGHGENSGGQGGPGEGPKFTFNNSSVNLRYLHETRIAGSGKSTLSATIVNNLRKRKTPVAAQFFISRNIPETVDPKKLVPTIALQLAEFSPAAAHIIEATLKDGVPASQEEQVEELLLALIQEICKSNRVIILIDALDELEDAAVVVPKLLSLLAPTAKESDLPDKLRFIVTSRPEYWAVISSYESLNHAVFKQEALTTDKDEFWSFTVGRFQEIKKELNIKGPGWDDWPSGYQMSKLSEAADGLFHYAATALQWIKEQIQRDGTTAKGWVFEKFSKLGTGDLEELYKVILTSFENMEVGAQDPEQRENRLQSFRDVIGTILVLYEPLTIGQIIALSSQKHFDVKNFLCRQFCSVLIPGTSTSFEEATPQMHKSFRDYIMGEHAPPEFHIHMGQAHFGTAKSCLEVIVGGDSQSDAVLEYSNRHWYKHLRKAVEGEATFQDEGIWNLLGMMVEGANAKIEKGNAVGVFIDVGTVGWRLLESGENFENINKGKRGVWSGLPLLPILALLTSPHSLPLLFLSLVVRAILLSLVLALLTSCPLLASSGCEVRAAPLSPVLAPLTSCPLRASSGGCVPLLCRWSLPHSLPVLFVPLVVGACRSSPVRAAPLSPVLALLTSRPLCASSRRCVLSPVLASLTSPALLVSSRYSVRAAPLSPVLASLTSRPLLASSWRCVPLLCRQALPHSLPVLFVPLAGVCHSSPVRAILLSPVLALLTSHPLRASSGGCVPLLCRRSLPRSLPVLFVPLPVRAAPLLLVLASLTSRPLCASSRRYVPLLCRRSLPRSLPALFVPLAGVCHSSVAAGACHSSVTSPCLAHFPSSSCLQWSVRAAPLSPVLASLTSRPPCASSRCMLLLCRRSLPRSLPVLFLPLAVRAAPLLLVLASLTSCPLCASSRRCVPLLCRWSLPRSLPVLFVPLATRACRSSVTGPCLTHFPSSSCLYRCMLLLCRRSLPRSLPILFLPLAGGVCHSSVAGPCLTHFPSSSCL
ncbi:hypothetical protein MSAN_02415200 [Mycena sanguinolenta]|uniref:NACHT domain-containing protein n=1 Tax=Mycena sanguinolenta TaxID=230812 RepID=A0A8H6X3M2_9AGAR|nr:hypothetical protein MSAN_02415200 [Mycena sanguinolenta]